jgi:short subunit dehydrogenase-like uncharacterized protein
VTDIWVLGATGRGGRGIAAELLGANRQVVLVGRDAARLEHLVAELSEPGRPTPRTLCAADAVGLIEQHRPQVVVNTIGPFGATAVKTARACLRSGSHYVDLANELEPVQALLGLDAEAKAVASTVVTGAGFGVLATEALVIELCAGRPSPSRVRVAAMPTVAGLGSAVLASIIDVVAGGGWTYRGGMLRRARLGTGFERTPLPDGGEIPTVGVPTGELEAARRASNAPDITAASSEVPTGLAVRAALPLIAAVFKIGPLRRGILRLVGRFRLTPPVTTGNVQVSWAHARVDWTDGKQRSAWLRTGEGYLFTSRVAALVAGQLADGTGRPGAFTPAALFGVGLAREAGGEIIVEGVAV